MSRIHVFTPGARSMNDVLPEAFRSFNCEPLGGPSQDGWSKMSDFLRCPYRYYLRHEVGAVIKPDMLVKAAPAPEVGGLVHACLALHYGRYLPEGFPGWRKNPPSPFDLLDRVQELGAEMAVVQEARRLYYGYSEQYGVESPDYGFEPVAVEYGAGIVGTHTCRYDMLAWNQGSLWIYEHKCLPADSVVYTKDGPRTIGALASAGAAWECAAFDGTRLQWATASAPKYTGVQRIYSIALASGRRLRYGYKHPVLTRRGWVPTAELQTGDEVAVALDLPETSNTFSVPPMFYVLGALLSDGTLTQPGCTYTKTSAQLRGYYAGCLRELGMSTVGGREDPNRFTMKRSRDGRAPYIRVSRNSSVARMVEALGLRTTAPGKHIPSVLLSLSKAETGALLGGLFSGDGSMTVYRERRNGGQSDVSKVRICYGSRSRKLCEGVASLLAKLGVAATITDTSVEYKGARRAYHYATVVGRESKLRFAQLVGDGLISGPLPLREKAAACRAALEAAGQRSGPQVNIENGIWWDEVESSIAVGNEPTYDVTVPTFNTFVADGVITHNTAHAETQEVMEGWWLDGEIIGEVYGYQLSELDKLFGGPLVGVVINLLIKTHPPKFRRLEIVFPQKIVDSFARDRHHWGQQRESYRRRGHFPRSLQGCMSRYDMCQYWAHCRDEDASLLQIREAPPNARR